MIFPAICGWLWTRPRSAARMWAPCWARWPTIPAGPSWPGDTSSDTGRPSGPCSARAPSPWATSSSRSRGISPHSLTTNRSSFHYRNWLPLNKLQDFQQLRYLHFLNCRKEKFKCQIQFQESFFSRFTQLKKLFIILFLPKHNSIWTFLGEGFFWAEGCWCWKTSFRPNFGGDSN